MGRNFKDIDVNARTYFLFDDMINIKNIDLNKIKIAKNSNKNIILDM